MRVPFLNTPAMFFPPLLLLLLLLAPAFTALHMCTPWIPNSRETPIELALDEPATLCFQGGKQDAYFKATVPPLTHVTWEVSFVHSVEGSSNSYYLLAEFGRYNAIKGTTDMLDGFSTMFFPPHSGDTGSGSQSFTNTDAHAVGMILYLTHTGAIQEPLAKFWASVTASVPPATGDCDEGTVLGARSEPAATYACVDSEYDVTVLGTTASDQSLQWWFESTASTAEIKWTVHKQTFAGDSTTLVEPATSKRDDGAVLYYVVGEGRWNAVAQTTDPVRGLIHAVIVSDGELSGHGENVPGPHCMHPSPGGDCILCNAGWAYASGGCADTCPGSSATLVGALDSLGAYCSGSSTDASNAMAPDKHAVYVSNALSDKTARWYVGYTVVLTATGAGAFPERVFIYRIETMLASYKATVGVQRSRGLTRAAPETEYRITIMATAGSMVSDSGKATSLVDDYFANRAAAEVSVFLGTMAVTVTATISTKPTPILDTSGSAVDQARAALKHPGDWLAYWWSRGDGYKAAIVGGAVFVFALLVGLGFCIRRCCCKPNRFSPDIYADQPLINSPLY